MRRIVISTVETTVRATESEKYGMAKLITTDVSAVDSYSTIIEQAVILFSKIVNQEACVLILTCGSEEYHERNHDNQKTAAPDKI